MKTVNTIVLSYDEKAIANILGHNTDIGIECWDTGAIFHLKNKELICEWNGGVGNIPVPEDVTPNHIEAVIWEASKDSHKRVPRIKSL